MPDSPSGPVSPSGNQHLANGWEPAALNAYCAICGATTGRIFAVHGYWVRACIGCGHQFAEIQPSLDHVGRVYDDRYFHGANAGYPDYLAEQELLRAHGRWYGRLLEKFTRPGVLLDVGAAAGFVLQGFQDRGWNGDGIEPNARMAEFARNTLGLRVEATTLETFQSGSRYDLVSMIQVVAHLVDVREAFRVTS